MAAHNDFLCRPVVVIRTKDAFAETGAFEIFKSDGIDPKGKVELSARAQDFRFKGLSDVLVRGNGIKPFFERFSAIAFAPGLRLLAARFFCKETLIPAIWPTRSFSLRVVTTVRC